MHPRHRDACTLCVDALKHGVRKQIEQSGGQRVPLLSPQVRIDRGRKGCPVLHHAGCAVQHLGKHPKQPPPQPLLPGLPQQARAPHRVEGLLDVQEQEESVLLGLQTGVDDRA